MERIRSVPASGSMLTSDERLRAAKAQKARAKKQMASADPFAWAMKSVDDRFPDSREKDGKTLKEEAEVEAMVRKIMAKKRMAKIKAEAEEEAARREALLEEKATSVETATKVAPAKPVVKSAPVEVSPDDRPVNVVMGKKSEKAEKLEEAEKAKEAEKAIEAAFEEDAMEDDFDDEYYDDIDELEGNMYDDEEDEEEESLLDGEVDDGLEGEDVTKTEMLDGDLLKEELEKADFSSNDPEIMDDFDDVGEEGGAQKKQDAQKEQEEASVKEDANGRPVNMVLGKKPEEPEKSAEIEGEVSVEVEPMRQNVTGTDEMKDKIRAHQMDFEAEGVAKNPLIDDDKPTPEIKKVNSIPSPKAQIKMTGMELKQKKMLIGIIALAVLAVGGILFGVIAMINQGKASEELAQKLEEVSTTAASSSSNVDDEYIYIRDWGMKIKIISGLTDVSYNVATDTYAEVLIWGAKKDSTVSYTPDFARQAKNSSPLGTVVRVARYERAAAGRLIWYDDYYNYYYQGPSGIPAVSEAEMNWWVDSYLLIKDMLTNADNYMTMEDTTTIGQQ